MIVTMKDGTALLNRKEDCFGCTACVSVCPTGAIAMARDEEGFSYPSIDSRLCVSCGKCRKVCDGHRQREQGLPIHIFAARSRDSQLRMRSSSGGGFSLVARWVEERQGVICGADFDGEFRVVHGFGETEAQWARFCTSKYVQSDLGDAFQKIRQYLSEGRYVLFSGTPCQVQGLKSALAGGDTEKLITCDVVCHGTPSPRVWADYLRYLSRRNRTGIARVNFRDKREKGWHNSTLTVCGTNGKQILAGEQSRDCYFQLFFRHLILRPACHTCPYSNFSRPGDISLGDYWGIEKHFPEFDDDRGVSLLFCNTEKGAEIWRQIAQQMESFPVQPEQCTQPHLKAPAKRPAGREAFWQQYGEAGFSQTAKNMGLLPLNLWDRGKRFARRAAGKVKRTVYKWLGK